MLACGLVLTFLWNFTNVWSCYFWLLWNLMCFSTWLLPNCQPHFTWVNTHGSNIISLTRLRVWDMLVSKLAVYTLISNLLLGKVDLFNENNCELISETDNHGCWWYRVKIVSMISLFLSMWEWWYHDLEMLSASLAIYDGKIRQMKHKVLLYYEILRRV